MPKPKHGKTSGVQVKALDQSDSPTIQALVDQLKEEYLAAAEDFKANSAY